MLLHVAWLLALFGGMLAPLSAAEGRTRVALVIGNARYEPALGKLRNTSNDAKAVANTLRTLGFAVTERHDLTRDKLMRAVDEFRKTLSGAEIALFYYAGHGLSVAGSNYLIPLKSGFDPQDAEETTLRMLAETRLFNAEQVIADLSAAGAHCNLMILDACRNTPLMRHSRSRSVSGASGLAEMKPPAGSLIAFATEAGRTAFDGDGRNGLYTEELLRNMRSPGLTIEQVFKRTRAAVVARSNGGQVPAEYSRLIGDDIYLAGEAKPHPPQQVAAPSPTKTTPPAPSSKQLVELAKNGKIRECLEGLELLAEQKGAGEFAIAPLEILLEAVKEDLKEVVAPSTKVIAAAETCRAVLRVLAVAVPEDHPQLNVLSAKAHNRRGDALLILGRAEEAISEFDRAEELAPNDAYVFYNRARAHMAKGDLEAAKADLTPAASDRFKQPKARKLALKALAELL
ncbi:MAG TPA: caspase family protein [Chthoniobacteraceae bacterium]|jgi:tetratricopeptide (TPR) repeat protein